MSGRHVRQHVPQALGYLLTPEKICGPERHYEELCRTVRDQERLRLRRLVKPHRGIVIGRRIEVAPKEPVGREHE